MASQAQDTRKRFEELTAGSQLDIVVPTSAAFDPTTLFHDGLPGRLSSAPSRRNLYFDETTQLNLILRTSLGERAVRSLLGSLDIVIAAHATDAVPQGQGNAASASGKHDLNSKTISALKISNVLFAGEQTYIIWKPTIHISRLRVRLQRPAVYFTAIVSLTSSALNASRSGSNGVLKSFESSPTNVLEPLQFDPAFSDAAEIYLPEDRITKVLPPSASASNEVRSIRGATKRAYPIFPALYTRIRYSTLPDAVVASLHLEASQVVTDSLSIGDVRLEVESTGVRPLTSSLHGTSLLAGDEAVHLYKLTPERRSGATSSAGSVKIKATLNIEQGSTVGLDISWQVNLDLTKVASTPTYKWSRPLSGGSLHPPSRPSLQAVRQSSPDGRGRQPLIGGHGVSFRFTAETVVSQTHGFTVDVQCNNRSNRARRFALVVLHPRRHHNIKHQRNSSLKDTDLQASLFNAPSLEQANPPEILDINPDVRIGPLAPGAVFETHLEFRALATGPLDLGVIRIVDLDTRQTIDVRELPDIVAMKSRQDRASTLQ